MAEAVRSRKKIRIEDRIEEFCKNSAELISNIHERCGDGAEEKNTKKGKKGRKKKEKKE